MSRPLCWDILHDCSQMWRRSIYDQTVDLQHVCSCCGTDFGPASPYSLSPCFYILIRVTTYVENKNRHTSDLNSSKLVHFNDRDLLQWKTCLHACVHAFMPTCNICMFACLGTTGWSSWVVWLMTVVAQSPRAAPCCSFPLCSVPIRPFLL